MEARLDLEAREKRRLDLELLLLLPLSTKAKAPEDVEGLCALLRASDPIALMGREGPLEELRLPGPLEDLRLPGPLDEDRLGGPGLCCREWLEPGRLLLRTDLASIISHSP